MLIGAIADDFTGATDLANILAREGMKVVLTIGVPDSSLQLDEADAVVVALKSRTAPLKDAVKQSLAALNWLKAQGTQQFFFKYCSTFDSTPQGNIGPVADALSESLGVDIAVICPAFPANGRTVYNGHLFVGRQLLQDSPMKDHPLTPMRRSDLVALMAEQSQKNVGLIGHDIVDAGSAAIENAFNAARLAGNHYLVVDAVDDANLKAIGIALKSHRLITGGSAIAMGLPANFGITQKDAKGPDATANVPERTAILAGSCSAATRRQLANAKTRWPSFKIDVNDIASGRDVVGNAISWVNSQPAKKTTVIYGSADPSEVEANQARYGRDHAGTMMEQALADIAVRLVGNGVRRLVVAGGETSGAVVTALGVKGLLIGPEIAPGVPWTSKLDDPSLKLALKSGNFGGPDFFDRALEMAS